MNTIMTTSTFSPNFTLHLRGTPAGRPAFPALAQRQRIPKLALDGQPVGRSAVSARPAHRLVLPMPRESIAEQALFMIVALAAGGAVAETCGLVARLAPQWDAFTALVGRLIA